MKNAVLTRDDFVRILFADDFFTANPAFAPVEEAVTACKTAYQASAKKSTCGCGGASQLVFGCLDETLELMESMRTENSAALQGLVTFVSAKRNTPNVTSFTLYYRKTSKEPLRKVKFP